MAAEIDDRDLTEEELEDERRRRAAALATPTRLRPAGTSLHPEGAEYAPDIPTNRTTNTEEPEIARLRPAGTSDADSGVAPRRLKPLNFQERQRLPNISAGAPAGSAAMEENKIAKIEDQRANPYGSDENHPGKLGRLAHVLSRVGNIAGDIVAPAQMAMIPGTERNRSVEEERAKQDLATAQGEERANRKEGSEEEERSARTENLKNKDSEALAKLGVTRNENGEIVPDPTSPAFQKNQVAMDSVKHLQDLRDAQTELAEARTAVEKAKNDPNSAAFKMAQQRLAMAAEAHRVAAANLGLHQEQFANKLQEQELLKPSGQAQSRGSAAQAVIDLIPDLKNLVNKHREDMGPVMGRINRGEIAIGNVDPEIARLYSAMKSFYALQPAVHGFRNAEFVKDFEHALGTLERDPDAFIAGMEGLMPTLQSVAKEGKTFHKRIVEGKDQNAGGDGGEAPAGKVAVNDPQGVPHFVKADKIDAFLKDPKYKGWTRAAKK